MERGWVRDVINKFSVATVDELDISGALELKVLNMPSSLYKIRACGEYAFNNLRNKTLYLSVASGFNDPYDAAFWGSYEPVILEQVTNKFEFSDADIKEVLGAPDCLRRAYELAIEKGKLELDADGGIESYVRYGVEKSRQFQSEQLKWLVEKLQSSYKICSLSERLDSVVMWGHYGQNHTGFAMEYNYTRLHRNDVSTFSLWPVAYSKSLFDVTSIFVAQRRFGDKFNNLFTIAAALCKAEDWRYEREWRLVVPDGDETKGINLRAPLKAVHLGARISPEHEAEILKICAEINVPVFKMKLAPHEYRMISEPLGTT